MWLVRGGESRVGPVLRGLRWRSVEHCRLPRLWGGEPAGPEVLPRLRHPPGNSGILAACAVADAGGERKQVTVLFADVVDSMNLTATMDLEDWGELMGRFFAILRDGVTRFDGHVDKFTGDGIMALFGAPVAYEDHARQACAAALHLREELADYRRQLERERGISFKVRIGLNSGEVVAGPIDDEQNVEYTAVGTTVGLAQRMESLAEPGTVYAHRRHRRPGGGLFRAA